MIEIKKLCKQFDKKPVLNNLNITIRQGKIYGLLGVNGAGKTTLLRLIMGILLPDKGGITIDDYYNFAEEVYGKVFFMADELFFYNNYTVNDMIKFYQALYICFDKKYCLELCNLFDLDYMQKINDLSKGMKKQLYLALGFATRAKYMLLDEVFDGLDPAKRSLVRKIICKHVAESNATFIISSHNLREIDDMCDTIGILHQGRIALERDIIDLKKSMFKVQVACPIAKTGKDNFQDLDIIDYKNNGRVAKIVIRASEKKIKDYFDKKDLNIISIASLNLEEIFMYEMETLGYEYKEII
jgi:ABC-2 type transport system ATP-binding protein